MTEKLHRQNDYEISSPARENSNTRDQQLHALEKQSSEARHEHAEKVIEIRSDINRESVSKIETKEAFQGYENKPEEHRHYVTKKIKSNQYKQTLLHIQEELPKGQRTFSKIVHQPAIEAISEVGAKTIARPRPIISGALMAIIGSVLVTIIARHVGFEVPNSIFITLFIIGYLLFVVIELLLFIAKKLLPKRSHK